MLSSTLSQLEGPAVANAFEAVSQNFAFSKSKQRNVLMGSGIHFYMV